MLRTSTSRSFLLIGVIVLMLFILIIPVLNLPDPYHVTTGNELLSPAEYGRWGTDQYGRDVLSRVIWGGRRTLSTVLLACGVLCNTNWLHLFAP